LRTMRFGLRPKLSGRNMSQQPGKQQRADENAALT